MSNNETDSDNHSTRDGDNDMGSKQQEKKQKIFHQQSCSLFHQCEAEKVAPRHGHVGPCVEWDLYHSWSVDGKRQWLWSSIGKGIDLLMRKNCHHDDQDEYDGDEDEVEEQTFLFVKWSIFRQTYKPVLASLLWGWWLCCPWHCSARSQCMYQRNVFCLIMYRWLIQRFYNTFSLDLGPNPSIKSPVLKLLQRVQRHTSTDKKSCISCIKFNDQAGNIPKFIEEKKHLQQRTMYNNRLKQAV